ncbi:MAG: lipoate--protein ligase [Clostridia bacterium]|nr:lipoate--protein ligase [Clostridia bacterium]
MMRRLEYYIGSDTDPHRNLARERYLTESVPEDTCILYLWQNRHTVVIGRNQNAWRECRTTELEKDGGTLARRLSGGGAVYHDLGNLNFTFCMRKCDYDLARQQSVIAAACRRLGVQTEVSGRNDILANGKKFSGNSFWSHGGCAFHNGTLLLNVDMANLGRYLRPSQLKLESKGVSSVRSRVVNLCELAPAITVDSMRQAMLEAFSEVYSLPRQELRDSDLDSAEIERGYLHFHSYEWNYGKILPFSFECSARFAWGELTLQMHIKDGVCENAAAYTDALDEGFAGPLAEGLRGCRFTTEEICRQISAVPACAEVAPDICRLIREQNI